MSEALLAHATETIAVGSKSFAAAARLFAPPVRCKLQSKRNQPSATVLFMCVSASITAMSFSMAAMFLAMR